MKRVEKRKRRVEEGEKESGGKGGRGMRKVENREEESIGDRGEEWREEGVEYERECSVPLGGGEWRRRLSIVYCREGEGRRVEKEEERGGERARGR